MKLRQFNLNDYEEVVHMYYDFMIEVFGDKRKISPIYFYYKAVIDWINTSKHIIVVEKDNVLCGFSMCFIDEANGLTQSIYNCETCYVKPKYRKTKAGFLLYNNGVNVAEELRLNILANGRVENGVDKMIEKHFNLESMFINYEGVYNG